MAFEGYVEFGGNELVNTERARGYTRTTDCAVPWVVAEECESLVSALGHNPYTYANVAEAPWYDPSMPDVTSRFLGVVGLDIAGVQDSTRAGGVIEGIDDGGVMSRIRKGAREVRVTATLIGQGADALEYGIAWLSAALDPGACGQHGVECGTTDMSYFASCPPAREAGEAFEDYQLRVDPYRRYLHGVAATSGPLRLQLMKSTNGVTHGATMEFTITSERPWIYGVTRKVELPTSVTTVIDDTPFNLVPYPSAELTSGALVKVATNYSLNPSVETNATGWLGYGGGVVPAVTGARSTELASVGVASFKVTTTTTNSGTEPNTIVARQDVNIAPAPTGARFSINLWSTLVLQGGVAALTDILTRVVWLDAGGVTLGVTNVGTLPPAGGPASASSLVPPAGAVTARVEARGNFASWSVGATISLYADALAVTVP